MISSELLDQILAIEGATSREEIVHLHDLAAAVEDGCIVEIGSWRGRSTAALASGSQAGFGVPVFAIDPHEEFTGYYGGRFGPEDRAAFFRSMLELGLYHAVRLVNLSSEYLASAWPSSVRLLWIDGDHRYDAVKRDIESWLPKLHERAIVVFDDALDPAVGPRHVIDELVAGGGWERHAVIGKTATIIREIQRNPQSLHQ